jgi:glucokinase
MNNNTRLIGDIGGTNARFALFESGEISRGRDFACADYPDIASAIETYLHDAGVGKGAARPREAALAVATPLTGDVLQMTNNPWRFSLAETRRRLGLDRLLALNDFTALAMSLTALDPADLEQVGGDAPVAAGPIALLGAGTGLGVSGLIPAAGSYVPLQGEGGHVTLFATNEREHAAITILQRRFQHVSAERILSGPGLANLHEALCMLAGGEPEPLDPEEIARRGLANTDPLCRETLDLFCAFFGGVAGNLALTLGAVGGVYIGGGVIPRWGSFFANSLFRERFAAKGRYADYLSPIPAFVIHAKRPAFLGLAKAFTEPGPRLEAQ